MERDFRRVTPRISARWCCVRQFKLAQPAPEMGQSRTERHVNRSQKIATRSETCRSQDCFGTENSGPVRYARSQFEF
jgi:hypothetical protein